MTASEPLHESTGAIHLHSDYSDGALSIPEIAAIAQSKGLDFLMFSDHNTLAPKKKGLDGWYDRILVIIGYEINDQYDQNHYLAFRIDQEIEKGCDAKTYVSRVKQKGGFGIIAHPAEKRNFSDAYPPYPWTEWDAEGFDGIEIWNQLSEWMEGVTRGNIAWRIWHPLRSIRFPVWETLERWDRFNRKRRVVGVGGIDVHAFQYKVFGFIPVEIYPYKVQFKSIRTHILTKSSISAETGISFEEAEKEVFSALSEGCCFISNHSIGDARGFRFSAESNGRYFPMGSRLTTRDKVTFKVKAPSEGIIRLLCDGREVMKKKDCGLLFESSVKGVYRVEIMKKKRGWIYSNPIVVLNNTQTGQNKK